MLENNQSASAAEKEGISPATIQLTSLEYEIRGDKLYIGSRSLEEIVGVHSQDRVAPEYRMDPIAIKQLLYMQEMLTSGKADTVCLPSPDDLYIYQREGNKVKLTSLRIPAEMQVKVMENLGIDVKLIEGNQQVPFEAIVTKPGSKEINFQNIPLILSALTGIKFDFKDTFKIDEKIFANESIGYKSYYLPSTFPGQTADILTERNHIPQTYITNRQVQVLNEDLKSSVQQVSDAPALAYHHKKNLESRDAMAAKTQKLPDLIIEKVSPVKHSRTGSDSPGGKVNQHNLSAQIPSRVKIKKESESLRQYPLKALEELSYKTNNLTFDKKQNTNFTGNPFIITEPIRPRASVRNIRESEIVRPPVIKPKRQIESVRGGFSDLKQPQGKVIKIPVLKRVIMNTPSKPAPSRNLTFTKLTSGISKVKANYIPRPVIKIISFPIKTIILKVQNLLAAVIQTAAKISKSLLESVRNAVPVTIVKSLSRIYQKIRKNLLAVRDFAFRKVAILLRPLRLLRRTFQRPLFYAARIIFRKARSPKTVVLQKTRLKINIKSRPLSSSIKFRRSSLYKKLYLFRRRNKRLELLKRFNLTEQELTWYFMRQAGKRKRRSKKMEFAIRARRNLKKPLLSNHRK